MPELEMLYKAELHCHLDGVITPALARRIRTQSPDFPLDPERLGQAYPVHDYDSFFAWWALGKLPPGQLGCYFPVFSAHVERLKVENVRYFELMVGAGLMPADPAQAVEAMTALRTLADSLETPNFKVNFLLAIGRNKTVEQMRQIGAKALVLHAAGLITGVNLAGAPEVGWPVLPFKGIFAELHAAGLGISIHAGEWAGPESVWDALENGFADRIGHGVALFREPRLIELFLERQIHVEMCPTSNVKTGSVARIEEHPIAKARQLGLSFSVNTDDPGVFENSMNGECVLLAETFGFDEQDFERIYQNSLAARFAG